MIDEKAREEAQKQWTARACGTLDIEKGGLEYFIEVEKARYEEQNWVHDYFQYDKFSGKRVLEIGVGQGTDLAQFGKSGAECYGVDITDNHLQITARNFSERGLNVVLYKADATQLPFPDGHFDCVYSFGVIHHIPEIERILEEVYRVLKPGGVFMGAVYHKWSAFHLFWKLLAHGLRHGWLFSKGYSGLLATIEEGADGVDIKPYVKLYSKGEIKSLLKTPHFNIEDVSVHQLKKDHFWPSFVANNVTRFIDKLDGLMGWYVSYRARKV